MRRNILAAILIAAFLVRFIGISSYPVGFTQDEAGIGYDAYSLLLTGKDHWGNSWPLVLRSFGDFKMPLYSYLAIPTVFLFGLNEFAVRLPNVIFGTLAVLATYLMVSKLSNRKDVGVWSALFLALSPWHISLSRGAFEANLTTFFIPIAAWCFLKGLEKPKWMAIAALGFGINLFSYHSARYFTPLILTVLIFLFRASIRKSVGDKGGFNRIFSRYRWAMLLFALFAFAAIFTTFAGASKRGLDITIFNPTDQWAAVSQKRYAGILQGIPVSVARLFSNKATYVFDTFVRNYLGYFSTTFLFTQGVSEWSYGMISGRGVLYLFEVITILFASYSIIKRKVDKGIYFIIAWIILAVIPASLTKGPGFSGTRAATMMPALQIFSAWGAVYLIELFTEKYKKFKYTFKYLIILLLGFSVLAFVENYFVEVPIQAAKAMSYGRKEVALYLNEVENEYDKIIVSRTLSVPHVWLMFYNRLDPVEIQKASKNWNEYEKAGFDYLDQFDGYRLGRYQFGNIFYEQRLNEPRILFVGRPEEFPKEIKPLNVIYSLDKSPEFYFVDPNGN